MDSHFLSQLQRSGWAKTTAETGDPRNLALFLESIASQLGTPVRHKFGVAEELFPRRAATGNPNSLSGKYGLAPFPLHCDTSHWRVPCRFVLVACVDPGSVPTSTVLLDTADIILSQEEQILVLSSVFLIKNGRSSFYSSIRSSNRHFIRLDPGCMKAVTNEGSEAMELYSYANQKNCVRRISWRIGDVLAIDNWRVLHGRGEQLNASADRMLLRVLVR